MKELSVTFLILVFGFMMLGPSSVVTVGPGLAFAQDDEGVPEEITPEDEAAEEVGPEDEAASIDVNINTASAEELAALDPISETLAQRIVEYGEANGPFSTIEDIKNVQGVGGGKFKEIMDFITVE